MTIDLTRLPPPTIIEVVDYETLRAQFLERFATAWEAARAKGGAARAAQLSAPVPKMATAGDVRDYLARVMRDAEAQLIAPRVATSLANLARVQLDAVAAAAEENKPAPW